MTIMANDDIVIIDDIDCCPVLILILFKYCVYLLLMIWRDDTDINDIIIVLFLIIINVDIIIGIDLINDIGSQYSLVIIIIVYYIGK